MTLSKNPERWAEHACVPEGQQYADHYLRSIESPILGEVIWHYVDPELVHPNGAYALPRQFTYCPWCGKELEGAANPRRVEIPIEEAAITSQLPELEAAYEAVKIGPDRG